MVKHVVKGEKWACSPPKTGKNKPIDYIAKTRDFKRFREINKEKSGILRLPIFGTSVHNRLTNDSWTYSFRAGFACDTSEKRNLKGNRS